MTVIDNHDSIKRRLILLEKQITRQSTRLNEDALKSEYIAAKRAYEKITYELTMILDGLPGIVYGDRLYYLDNQKVLTTDPIANLGLKDEPKKEKISSHP